MKPEVLTCSYCRKRNNEVSLLFAGPENITICDECIGAMMQILAGHHRDLFDKLVEAARNFEPPAPANTSN